MNKNLRHSQVYGEMRIGGHWLLEEIHPQKLTWISQIAIFERRYIKKEPSFLVSMLDFFGGVYLNQAVETKKTPASCLGDLRRLFTYPVILQR